MAEDFFGQKNLSLGHRNGRNRQKTRSSGQLPGGVKTPKFERGEG